MEKYVILLLFTAPGFIAKRTAKCLGDKPAKRGEFESVLIYFAYSLGSVLLTLFLIWLLGEFSVLNKWDILESKFFYPWFCAEFLLLSILSSIFVGGVWCLYIEKYLLKGFNWFNNLRNKNEVYLAGSMLHAIFDDDRNHLIQVNKDGKELAFGFFSGASSPTSEKTEIVVSLHKEFQILHQENVENKKEYMLSRTYVDITNSIIIKEFVIPDDWEIENGDMCCEENE